MITGETKEKVTATMEEAFFIVDGVRTKLEEQVDMDGGEEAESDNDIYSSVVDCGNAIVNSLSLIKNESDEKILESLTRTSSLRLAQQSDK